MSLNPLEQLNLVTIAAVAAIFLVTYVALRRLLFEPLLALMDRRARRVAEGAAAAEEARALVARAQQEAAKLVADATAAAERLERDVKDELARLREARVAEANARTGDLLARGRAEVSRIRSEEDARLEEQLLACSRQALLKMAGEVDAAALRLVVARVLAAGEATGRR
jgi:F-type H+-transporting ATPase subunit b